MAVDQGSDHRLLRSWKAIAAHLQVDVRTVQRWAAKSDIPIYRHGVGTKSHPTAYSDELTAWLTARRAEEPSSPLDNPLPAATARVASKRWQWAAVVGAAVLLLCAVLYVVWIRPRAGQAYRCTVEHGVLRTFDAAGREIWQAAVPDTGIARLPASGEDDSLIADIDGDGRNEVLYNLPMGKGPEASGRLLCFGASGRPLWQFSFGRPLSWQERRFSGKYGGRIVRLVRSADRRYVLVVANHSLWYPSQVALLDPRTGTLVEEYWHPGALHAALEHDIDGDGVDELLLGGTNNPGQGLGHAVLAVLKVPFSRSPRRTGVEMADFSGGREARYLAFARPDLCSASGDIPFATDLAIDTNRVRVRIACAAATVFHLLTFGLDASEMRLSDNFLAVHRQLEARLLLDHPWSAAEQGCLQRVGVFDTAVDGNSPRLAQYWKGCE